MKEIKFKSLRSLTAIYLCVPLLIFFWGWLSPLAASAFTLLLSAAVFFLIRKTDKDDFYISSMNITWKKLLVVILISVLWCVFAGQGGFIHQSEDHLVRNMVIKDLVRFPWPVTYPESDSMLCYYIAHWMVPALFGKAAFLASGSAAAGYAVCNVVLLIWSSFGCFLTFMLFSVMTCRKGGKGVFLSVAIFILFSGADIILASKGHFDHLEYGARFFQYSSNSTCLFWVYNQAIAAWLATLCILNEKKVKNFAILALFAFPYAPLPFIGLFLICIARGIIILVKGRKTTKFLHFLGQVFSPQNLLAALSIGVVFLLYFGSNQIASGGDTGFRLSSAFFDSSGSLRCPTINYLKNYIFFIFTEFLFLALALFPYKKKDPLFHFTVIALFFIPFIQVGTSIDFCMRASIPFIIYLCTASAACIQKDFPDREELSSFGKSIKQKPIVLVIAVILFGAGLIILFYTPLGEGYITPWHRLILPVLVLAALYVPPFLAKKFPGSKLFSGACRPKRKLCYTALIIIVLLGSFTAFIEFRREISATVKFGSNFHYEVDNTLADKEDYYNFLALGYQDSAFYKYLCKK